MTEDWLLVETLGDLPVVVAQAREPKDFVPLAVFLRREPNLAAIQTAIAETVTSGTGLASITSKTNHVIRTEPVQMTDGRIHAVHVWCGPADAEPADRPIPGLLKWDLTAGHSTATAEYLTNAGIDPIGESLTGRAFVEDVPVQGLSRDDAKALAWAIDAGPDRTSYTTWDFTDAAGDSRRVGWWVRTLLEASEDGEGGDHLVARAINLLESVAEAPTPGDPANTLVDDEAQPGVYRMLLDPATWTLLKWIDDPCPYFHWRGRMRAHPEDRERAFAVMAEELKDGRTSGILRLADHDRNWPPFHVTAVKVELAEDVHGVLATLRVPTDAELAQVGLDQDGRRVEDPS